MRLVVFYVLCSMFYVMPALAQGGRLDLGIEYGSLTGLGTREVRETVATLINVALGFLGIVAVVVIMAGGFFWMTSSGSEEKIEKAKGLILGGVVGLAIILSAYAIANFVIRSLERATIGP